MRVQNEIALDGDIATGWIKSLNTLMDDNKILTLASKERTALATQMRLLFEISHLRCATPSSVSAPRINYGRDCCNSKDQDGFDGSQFPIVMILFGYGSR